MECSPWVILGIGLGTVLGLMLLGRVHAFVALIVSGMVVSLLAPGPIEEKIPRVADAFGATAGKIGVVIALAALVGKAMLDSGAADRIVRSALRVFGPQRAAAALCLSGFILAIPVFFDMVFYLLVPLAYSLWRQTRKNYVLYLTAIAAGGVIAHTLVPPTPGPLYMAPCLNLDLGVMILVGTLFGLPMAGLALLVCQKMNRAFPIPMRLFEQEEAAEETPEDRLPPLWLALLPVVLPVILISVQTLVNLWVPPQQPIPAASHQDPSLHEKLSSSSGSEEPPLREELLNKIRGLIAVVGNANFALLLSAVIALGTVMVYRGWNLRQIAVASEQALTSGGVIILITSAGGAFGAMLGQAGLKESVQQIFPQGSLPPTGSLVAAFVIAALLKIAQGSSTVAIMTTANMFAALGVSAETLGFHPVYLATTIASGSLVGSWMNDSGFWIFAKMGGLTETETLKTWTILLAVIGTSGFLLSLLVAWVAPLV